MLVFYFVIVLSNETLHMKQGENLREWRNLSQLLPCLFTILWLLSSLKLKLLTLFLILRVTFLLPIFSWTSPVCFDDVNVSIMLSYFHSYRKLHIYIQIWSKSDNSRILLSSKCISLNEELFVWQWLGKCNISVVLNSFTDKNFKMFHCDGMAEV